MLGSVCDLQFQNSECSVYPPFLDHWFRSWGWTWNMPMLRGHIRMNLCRIFSREDTFHARASSNPARRFLDPLEDPRNPSRGSSNSIRGSHLRILEFHSRILEPHWKILNRTQVSSNPTRGSSIPMIFPFNGAAGSHRCTTLHVLTPNHYHAKPTISPDALR